MVDNKAAFLDIDPKIIENNLILQECQKPDLDALLGLGGAGNSPWKLVNPKPGFCVKTIDSEKNKVFVNVCTLEDIPEPRDVDEDKLLELIEAQDAEDFRVPLSLQEPREDVDKSGKAAMCYDVAINPRFYQKVEQSSVFKMFLLQVTFDGLKDKFDVDLDIEDYVILKNRKCVGTLIPHRIRTLPAPYRPPKQLIQEVYKTTPHKSKMAAPSKTHESERPTAEDVKPLVDYRMGKISKDGKEYLYGEVHLPATAWSKDINFEVGEDRVVVESRRAGHVLDVFLPFNLDQDGVQAEFSTSDRILHFITPILSAA